MSVLMKNLTKYNKNRVFVKIHTFSTILVLFILNVQIQVLKYIIQNITLKKFISSF